MPDVDGLNAGFASALLEQYLENPEAVPAEWRTLFESGSSELVAGLPGLERLLETLRDGNGHAAVPAPAPVAEPAPAPPAAPPAPAPAVDEELLGAVASAVALVKSIRTHGHLAARLGGRGCGST